MILTDIIPHLIAGEKVRRFAWRHTETYLFLHVAPSLKKVTIRYHEGSVSTFHISNVDAWADDWEVYP